MWIKSPNSEKQSKLLTPNDSFFLDKVQFLMAWLRENWVSGEAREESGELLCSEQTNRH